MTTIKVGQSDMPSVGLGIWKIDKPDTANAISTALEIGYRHIDSASDYGNEREAGEGIRHAMQQGTVSRDDLWVTSKLWNTYHRKEHVRAACERTLTDLGLDYLDLYLIHFPIALQFVAFDERYPAEWFRDPESANPSMQLDNVPLHETWEAMESLVDAGLVREIGVCNYNSALIHDLMAYARIKPAMLQVEAHPFLTQDNLLRTASDYDVAVTAFSPLGALSYVSLDMATAEDTVLTAAPVVAAAERLQRTPAQIVLRWGIQRGTAIIPKTTRRERLIENIALFDFALTDDDMQAISALNQNRRFNDPANFCEKAFNRFHAIYD
ncbi:MAG: aldo/keto reductase [Pseudomonadota bacterium]